MLSINWYKLNSITILMLEKFRLVVRSTVRRRRSMLWKISFLMLKVILFLYMFTWCWGPRTENVVIESIKNCRGCLWVDWMRTSSSATTTFFPKVLHYGTATKWWVLKRSGAYKDWKVVKRKRLCSSILVGPLVDRCEGVVPKRDDKVGGFE